MELLLNLILILALILFLLAAGQVEGKVAWGWLGLFMLTLWLAIPTFS